MRLRDVVNQLVPSVSGSWDRTTAGRNLIRRATGVTADVPIRAAEAVVYAEGIERQARQQVAESVIEAMNGFDIDDDYWDDNVDELWTAIYEHVERAVS